MVGRKSVITFLKYIVYIKIIKFFRKFFEAYLINYLVVNISLVK